MHLGDVTVLVANAFTDETTSPAEWISDVRTKLSTSNYLCIRLTAWMPGGMTGFIIYQNSINVIANITFLRLYLSNNTFSGAYQVAMPASTTLYQIVLYFNVIGVAAGQDAGIVHNVNIIDGLCSYNSEPSFIIIFSYVLLAKLKP